MKAIIALSLFICAGTAHSFEGQDAYGPGIHSDATGRPYSFDPSPGSSSGQVELNGYGPGVHKDQYGRAVRARAQDGHDETLLLNDDDE